MSESEADGEKKRGVKRAPEDSRDVAGPAVNPDEDDDATIGPLPTDNDIKLSKRKKKVLEFEHLYLRNLPDSEGYERSYMHRDAVSFVIATPKTDFIVTASCDGHVKFWKKQPIGIEFVKHFRAHLGRIQDMVVNHNGTLLCTVSDDNNAKIFDVVNFDMINMRKLGKLAL